MYLNRFKVLFFCLLIGSCGNSNSPSLPKKNNGELVLQPVFNNLNFSQPIALVQAPEDNQSWYLVEKEGRVWVFDNNHQTSKRRLFLDISNRVNSKGFETGLLGLSFHPDFKKNKQVYVSYTQGRRPLVSIISRFTSRDNGKTLDNKTEEKILTLSQTFSNHNGGDIKFGPDGFLYISFGDGGSGNDPKNDAQNRSNLLGNILRIDVNAEAPYAIPKDNPFKKGKKCQTGFNDHICPEIYAYGLRNVWRFSFDKVSKKLWAADVGQNRYEEINIIEKGKNYGWRIKEGLHCNHKTNPNCDSKGLTDPIWEYSHKVGQSITGGYVYRGQMLPELQGKYIFADFVSGRIWQLPIDNPKATEELFHTRLNISSFAESNQGELYVLDLNGKIHQIARAKKK